MNKKIKIGGRFIGAGEPCFIIAEGGVNHNGSLELAKKLVDVAVDCKADAVKFQKRSVEKILTREALEMSYLGPTSFGETYGEHRRKLELSHDAWYELKDYCEEKGIMILASVWDEESADFIEELEVPAFKIPSADLINLPLLEHVAKKEKPIILSTGMSNMEEIEDAVNTIKRYNDELILLQCTSTYPSEHEDINLRVMETLKDRFDVLVGYSGHERGIAVSEAAAALGAVIVERHFTLDSMMKGPDHAASLEPPGLLKLIRDIRNIEIAMGSSEKRIQEREKTIRTKLAKSVVAAVDIAKGMVITKEMLTVKGPNTGLSPKYIYLLPGKRVVKDIKGDSVITEEMVELE